ncbi:MAG: hypothetical protein WD512_18825 [Candidatus Paceibacterota bacterium]
MTQIPLLISDKINEYLHAIYLLEWKSRIKLIHNEYDQRVEYNDDHLGVKKLRGKYITIKKPYITYNYLIHNNIKMQTNFQAYNKKHD